MKFGFTNKPTVLRLRGGNLYNPSGCFPISAQFCPGYNMYNPFPGNCCNLPVIILTMPPNLPVPISQDLAHLAPQGFVTPAQPVTGPISSGAPAPRHGISPLELGRLEGLKKKSFPRKFSLPPINLAHHIPQMSQVKDIGAPDDPANAVINVELVPAQQPSPVVPKRPRARVASKISDSPFDQPPFHSSGLPPGPPCKQLVPPFPKFPKDETWKSLAQQTGSISAQSPQEQLRQSIARPQQQALPPGGPPGQVTQLEAMLEEEPYLSSYFEDFKTLKPYPLDKSNIGDLTRAKAAIWDNLEEIRKPVKELVHGAKQKEAQIKSIQQQPNWRQDEIERKKVADLLQRFFENRRVIALGLMMMDLRRRQFLALEQEQLKKKKADPTYVHH